MQDIVFAVRRSFYLESGASVLGVATFEPPTTGNLEHRAVGVGGGVLYSQEWTNWSGVAYALGRTENSLEEGQRRGNRLFLGSGVAYETESRPFSPQLGISWENTAPAAVGRRRIGGSDSSVVFVHPTSWSTSRNPRRCSPLSLYPSPSGAAMTDGSAGGSPPV